MKSVDMEMETVGRASALKRVLVGIGIALLLALGMFGGYILALLLALSAVVGLIVMQVAAIVGWVRRRKHGGCLLEASRNLGRTVPQVVAIARVIQAQGMCPLGQRFRVGQMFLFTEDTVAPDLCPLVRSRLEWVVGRCRRGEDVSQESVVCQDLDHGHRVVFGFRLVRDKVRQGTR